MHKEVLTKEQKELLPLIKLFSKEYYLAGGIAIALTIRHQRSKDAFHKELNYTVPTCLKIFKELISIN